jgi:putative endonuclease
MVRCADDSLYVGITNDVDYRVGQHNFGIDPECYTFKRRPVHLVYTAEFGEVIDAISWEKHIKKWSRGKKLALAAANWDEVRRLARSRSTRS